MVEVSRFTEWIKQQVGGSGFLIADEDFKEPTGSTINNQNMLWDEKSAFCEFKEEGG